MMIKPILGWSGLVVTLYVTSFGIWNFVYLILCSSLFIGIGILTLFTYGVNASQEYWNMVHSSHFEYPSTGIRKIDELLRRPVKMKKCDRRLTGASIIDEQLQEILQYTFRDYVQTWYGEISDDTGFLNDLREAAQNVIIAFSNRAKEVDWVPYLTTKLVDDFASHLRLFRQAQYRVQQMKYEAVDGQLNIEMLSIFFDLEVEMERDICHDLVCTVSDIEREYLQDLSEVLLFLLLPPGDFHNKPFRYLARELLVNVIFLPTVTQFSDPDYVNQIILWLCKEIPMTSESFLTIIRVTDNVEELHAVRESVTHEIAVQRSRDSGGDEDAEIKQQLNSLLFVQKVVDNRIRQLQEGIETDSSGLPSAIDWAKYLSPGQKLVSLPLDVILKNNVALSYFIDFMSSVNGQGYLYFYLNVEGFRVSAEQQVSAMHLEKLTNPEVVPADLEPLREAALNIYDQYLSEKAVTRICLDEVVVRRLLTRIRTETPTESWFDEIQAKVYDILQEDIYFPTFKKSTYYIKLLAELDLLKDFGKSDDEEANPDELQFCYDTASLSSLEETGSDTSSVASMAALSSITPVPPILPGCTLTTNIIDITIVKEGNKSYAVYAIEVIQRADGSRESRWQVYRRYSDFHDFHMTLYNKFANQIKVSFPGKKTFNNMNRQFLDKRMRLLNDYLQELLNPEVLKNNSGLWEIIRQFLEPVPYKKSKGQLARKVDNIKNSVYNLSHAVRSVPDNFMHNVDGMMDGISRAFHNRLHGVGKRTPLSDNSKVAACLDVEADDNIPLRIMLLLMDEIFDLKSRNQWLRRRIVTILRQIIKATFGDRINRKIIDYVEWWTAADQVAEYIKAFKQAFWPNGSLALPALSRDENTKMRTRVAAKAAMLCRLSDELKHIIGSETTRRGIFLVFEMVQQRTLNRRLVYVLLEGFLETLFPDNKFPTIFRNFHSNSSRIKSINGHGDHI